jgi:hypothetical protein
MKQLTEGGWEPDSVVDAVVAGDLSRLKGNHSGLFSIQLQQPGPKAPAAALPVGETPAAPVTPTVEAPATAPTPA